MNGFQKSFAWLTGMKKLIFYFSDFFGSGHVFDPSQLKKWPKKTGAKKFKKVKNHLFHAHQPQEEIFEIPSY